MHRAIFAVFVCLLSATPLHAGSLLGMNLASPDSVTPSVYDPRDRIIIDSYGSAHLLSKISGKCFYSTYNPNRNVYNPYLKIPGYFTTSDQSTPKAIASDGAGGAYAVWQNTKGFVCILRVGPKEALWKEGPRELTLCTANTPIKAIPDGVGGCLVIWADKKGMLAQRISQNGKLLWADGIQLSADVALTQEDIYSDPWPTVTDGSGGLIVLLSERIPAPEIGGRVCKDIIRVSGDGVCQWVHRVAVYTRAATLKADNQGGCFVAWDNGKNVFAKHLDADGGTIWTTEKLNTKDYLGCIDIVPDKSGGAICVWAERNNNGAAAIAQKLDASGNILWEQGGIAASPNQQPKCLIPDGDGGAFLIYRNGLYMIQHIGSNGELKWDSQGLSYPFVDAVPDGKNGIYTLQVGGNSRLILGHWVDYWTFGIGRPTLSQPTIALGVLYIGDEDGYINAFAVNIRPYNQKYAASIGSPLFRYPGDGGGSRKAPIRAPIAQRGGLLISLDSEGVITALKNNMPFIPELYWQCRPDTNAIPFPGPAPGVVTDDYSNALFAPINTSQGAFIYKLDFKGNVLDRLPAGNYIRATPVLYGDRIIYTCNGEEQGALRIARAKDLTILATYGTKKQEVLGSVVVDTAAKRVYASDSRGDLWALDLTTNAGITNWPQSAYQRQPGPIKGSLVSGKIYAKGALTSSPTPAILGTTIRGQVFAIDSLSGNPVSGFPISPPEKATFEGSPFSSFKLLYGNKALSQIIYAGSVEGSVYAFDALNPGEYQSMRVPSSFTTDPAVYLNQYSNGYEPFGIIFYSGNDGTLYGFPIR